MIGRAINVKTVPLLGRGKIHPALHIDGEGVILGRMTEAGECQLVTSERTVYAPDDIKEVLAFKPRPYADLAGRWADEDVERFLLGEGCPTFSEVLALTIKTFDDAVEFPRVEHRVLLAVWSLASYFFPLFLTFPRLNFTGERESGKSKALTLLRAVGWNALFILDPTPAVLYRLIHEFRPTLLLDELEGLNKEDGREVLAIINSGYKLGGTVPRCEGEKKRQVELFQVYSPLALAAIRSINPTTEDRCIPLVLQRGTDRRRLNAEADLNSSMFTHIRSGCHRLLLTGWRDVRETYRSVSLPTWLNARARELWRPLLAVAHIADRENDLRLTPDLLDLAKEHVDDRSDISAEGEALLAVLADRLGDGSSVVIRPGELSENLRQRLGWRDAPTPEHVSAWLRRFRFPRAKPPRDRAGVRYQVTADRLKEVRARYLREEGNGA